MRDHGAAAEIRVFVTDQEPEPAYELGSASSGRRWNATRRPLSTPPRTPPRSACCRPASPSRPPLDGWVRRLDMAPTPSRPHHPSASPASRWAELPRSSCSRRQLFRMIDQNLHREEISDVILDADAGRPLLHRPEGRKAGRSGLGVGSCHGVRAPSGRLRPAVKTRNAHGRRAGGCSTPRPETPADAGHGPPLAPPSLTHLAVAATAQKAPQTPQRR
jgi:hypothetical protein